MSKSKNKKGESFIFYKSFFDAIELMPYLEQLGAYRAIANYALNEITPNDLTDLQKIVFIQAKPQIDANRQRKEDGAKGGKYGGLGGRGKKKNPTITPSEPQENPIGVNKENPIGVKIETPNDNDNDNDNVECLNDNDLKENISINRDKKETEPKFNFRKALLELGVDEAVADEWIAIRKLKKKTNSEYALSREIAQVEKAGITMAEALTICCDNGWGQFKAEWLGNLIRSQSRIQTNGGGAGFSAAQMQAIVDVGVDMAHRWGSSRTD